MRTNLAHVSPICIYMNRRGLRDWNKFERLSKLGNLYTDVRANVCVCVCVDACEKEAAHARARDRDFKSRLCRNRKQQETNDDAIITVSVRRDGPLSFALAFACADSICGILHVPLFLFRERLILYVPPIIYYVSP